VKLGRDAREVCRRSLRWNRVTRSDNRFEALMAYYHITQAQNYVQQLGFSQSNRPRNGINDRSQVAVADAFSADNDFYSPFDQTIRYGTGGVDDAEDADVIVHEYAHAMQDSQSHGFVTSGAFQDGSLAEGSADYWAAVMSSLWAGTTNTDDVCIFDWDGTTWGPVVPAFHRRCGRRADDERTLSQAKNDPNDPTCSFDVHCVGQVWSSALWDLRQVIGAQRMDRIYLTAQFLYHSEETFNQAASALVKADELLFAGAHKATICAEMKGERGLSPSGCT
jgi:hypothetical protein